MKCEQQVHILNAAVQEVLGPMAKPVLICMYVLWKSLSHVYLREFKEDQTKNISVHTSVTQMDGAGDTLKLYGIMCIVLLMLLVYMKVILNHQVLIPSQKIEPFVLTHTYNPPKDAGYSLDYTECDKGDEDTAHLLLAVKEAARVMLGSLLAKLVGESTLPVLWELEWRKKTLGWSSYYIHGSI